MGAYVQASLIAGEEVKANAVITWISQIWYYIFAVLTSPFLLILIALELTKTSDISVPLIFILLGMLPVLFILVAMINVKTTELAVTNKKVIGKTGFIARQSLDLPINKLESMNVSQGVLGRLLGFGKITVHGTGGNKVAIPFIKSPLAFRNNVMVIVDQKSNEMKLQQP